MESHEHAEPPAAARDYRLKMFSWGGGVVALLAVIGYFSFAFMTKNDTSSGGEGNQAKPLKVIQLDVLNGSRIRGAAARVTSHLRTGGFDVVEMKNYKMNNVHQTVVIDRVGNLASAHRVARALGVSEKNVVQQINPDYFVDVSVIIGEDFSSLKIAE
ncbi:MAG TPA: LytR C-terminal domain-containing protein [Bacteroidota bacterium]|nr:LytR C-terminal domain-containing protein [Bacteroidota bacterium]